MEGGREEGGEKGIGTQRAWNRRAGCHLAILLSSAGPPCLLRVCAPCPPKARVALPLSHLISPMRTSTSNWLGG